MSRGFKKGEKGVWDVVFWLEDRYQASQKEKDLGFHQTYLQSGRRALQISLSTRPKPRMVKPGSFETPVSTA